MGSGLGASRRPGMTALFWRRSRGACTQCHSLVGSDEGRGNRRGPSALRHRLAGLARGVPAAEVDRDPVDGVFERVAAGADRLTLSFWLAEVGVSPAAV